MMHGTMNVKFKKKTPKNQTKYTKSQQKEEFCKYTHFQLDV